MGQQDTRGVEAVRVDAGPELNGVMLEAGLIDEVTVLVAPYLVGGGRSFLDQLSSAPPLSLEFTSAEPQADGHVWLRYAVVHP